MLPKTFHWESAFQCSPTVSELQKRTEKESNVGRDDWVYFQTLYR